MRPLSQLLPVLGRALSRLKGYVLKDKSSSVQWSYEDSTPPIDSSDPDANLVSLEAYSAIDWVHMALSVKSEAAAMVPLKVKKKGGKELFPNHLLMKLLVRPNPHDVGVNFRRVTMQHLELVGSSYWQLIRDSLGVVRQLYPLDSSRVAPIPDPVIKVSGYSVQTVSGQTIRLGTDEVLHFKYPDPTNPWKGLGRIEAMRRGLSISIMAEKYNLAFFQNNAVPAALLVPEEPLTPRQLNRVKALLRKEFQGVANQHGIGIIGANMKLEKVGITPKDIEFLEQQKFGRDKIGSMFHVPPIYMGNFSEASYANADAQRKMLWQATILPWLMWLVEHLNAELVPLVDPEVEYIIDQSFLIPLIESLPTLTKSLMDLRNGGFITTNEGRNWLGLDSLEGEEFDTIFIPGQFVTLLSQMEQEQRSTPPGTTPPDGSSEAEDGSEPGATGDEDPNMPPKFRRLFDEDFAKNRNGSAR